VSAFHYGYDGLLYPWFVNASNLDVRTSTGKRTCAYLFRITQYGKVGVVCCKDELNSPLKRPYQLNDVLKDCLVVQIIFRLVNNNYIIVALA
jgi:hypothetical protein